MSLRIALTQLQQDVAAAYVTPAAVNYVLVAANGGEAPVTEVEARKALRGNVRVAYWLETVGEAQERLRSGEAVDKEVRAVLGFTSEQWRAARAAAADRAAVDVLADFMAMGGAR